MGVPGFLTTCETNLDQFTGCEVMFTASKNAALVVFHNRNPSNLDSSDQQIRLCCDLNLNLDYESGAVFTKGLSQVSGLSWLYFCTKVKPKTWLRPFVNTAPDSLDYPKFFVK